MITKDSSMKILPTLTLLAAAAVTLTACGGGGGHAASASTGTPTATTSGGGAFRGGPPGTSGQIAELDGNTMQVQNPTSGQVAVTVTSTTRYTQAVKTTLAALTVGSCIVATEPASTSSGSTSAPATPSPAPTGPRTITASTVTITAPSSTGGCGGAFGQRGVGTGAPTGTRPSGFPTDLPTGAAGAGRVARAFGDIVAGKVTAITGSAISVQAEQRTPGSTTTTTVNDTVDVTPSTTFTHTVAASKSALKVGLCVDATGAAAADGTITASRVAITQPSGGACTTTFGRFGGGTVAGGPGGQ